MNWVKITERLPKAGLDYICRSKNPCGNENLNWITCFFDGEEFSSDHITHWLKITGPEEDFCEWKVNGEYNAYTSCGTIVGFRNTFNFCPNCGRKIKEVKP